MTIRSPGFEPHYSGGGSKCAPYEDAAIAACDLQGKIDAAVMEYVRSVERDDREILEKTTGQRQRVLRLWVIAEKSVGEISEMLGVSKWTVERRLMGIVPGKAFSSKFEQVFFENRLLPVDAEVEKHIACAYWKVQESADCMLPQVRRLIIQHEANARKIMARHYSQTKAIGDAVAKLGARDRRIITAHLYEGREWLDIAEELGLSESRVKHIYAAVISKIALVSA